MRRTIRISVNSTNDGSAHLAAPARGEALADLLRATLVLANKLSEREVLAKDGITLGEWAILSEFPSDGGEITLKRLIGLTGIAAPRLRVVMAKLDGRGIVRGVIAAGDSRARRFSLSPSGLLLRNEVANLLALAEDSVVNPSHLRALARSGRIVWRISKGMSRSGEGS
jgi:DNA-binding MarR family transcriptional regulator